MACLDYTTLKGITYSCEANLAGIKEIYLGYRDDFNVTTNTETKTAEITSVASAKLYKYTFAKRTGSMTTSLTKDETNGIRYYTTTINLQFNKMEGAKHLEIEAMAAEQLIAIVVDNNGKSWLVGSDSYVSADTTTAQTGQGFDELNGYQISMTGHSAYMPWEVTGYDSLVAA